MSAYYNEIDPLAAQWLRNLIAKDLIAASLVGFVAFAVSAWQAWSVWLLAVLLPLAGYGGARFLEPLTDAAVRRMTGVLGGAGGKENDR